MTALLTLTILALMLPVAALAYFQQFFVLPRLRREIELLYERRAKRVQQALSETMESGWGVETQSPTYAFSGWVEFLDTGSLRVAGQKFSVLQAFQVTARDHRNIPRANVTCLGDGKVLIASHGQVHSARFSENKWQIELLESPLQ